ncbi:hypothetical protein ACA910_007013 [Epithemia clementina (nom. ined.)]
MRKVHFAPNVKDPSSPMMSSCETNCVTTTSTRDESMSGVNMVQHRRARPRARPGVSSMALPTSVVTAVRPNMGPWPKLEKGPRWDHSMVLLEQEHSRDKEIGEGVNNHQEQEEEEDITVIALGGQQRHGQRDNSVLLLTIPAKFLTSVVWESNFESSPNMKTDASRFECSPLTWHEGPPLLEPRINCAAVICNAYLYVIGGYGHGIRAALDDIERILVSDLHQWAAAQSAAAKNVTIPTTTRPPVWTRVESRLRTPRAECSAVAVANRFIVVLGGLGSQGEALSNVEIIDTKAVREIAGNNGVPTLAPVVVEGPSLRIPRYLFEATVLPNLNEIWVVEGKDEHGDPLSSMESLRFGTKCSATMNDNSNRPATTHSSKKEPHHNTNNAKQERGQEPHSVHVRRDDHSVGGFFPRDWTLHGNDDSSRNQNEVTRTKTSEEVVSLFYKEPLHPERDSIDVAFSSATLAHFTQPRTGCAMVQIKCKGKRTSGPNSSMARERILVLVSGGLCENNKGLDTMESFVLTLPEPRNDEMLFHTERIALLRPKTFHVPCDNCKNFHDYWETVARKYCCTQKCWALLQTDSFVQSKQRVSNNLEVLDKSYSALKANAKRSIPMYFVILPRNVTAGCNPWEILKSLFTSVAKQKLNLFFICAHSGDVVSPPIELEVSRPWFQTAAPFLIWSLQALSMAFEAVSFPATLDLGHILCMNLALDKNKAILEALRKDIRDNCNTASHDLIERICPDTVNGEDMNRIYNQIKGMDQCSINFLEKHAKSQCRVGGWREQMTQVLHKTSTGDKVKWVKNQFAQLPEYEPILKRENLPKHEQRRLAAEL